MPRYQGSLLSSPANNLPGRTRSTEPRILIAGYLQPGGIKPIDRVVAGDTNIRRVS